MAFITTKKNSRTMIAAEVFSTKASMSIISSGSATGHMAKFRKPGTAKNKATYQTY